MHYWQPFYHGQKNLRTDVRYISTPPVGRWDIEVKVVGLDGTLFSSLPNSWENLYLSRAIETWAQDGFPDLKPDLVLEEGKKTCRETANPDGFITEKGHIRSD